VPGQGRDRREPAWFAGRFVGGDGRRGWHGQPRHSCHRHIRGGVEAVTFLPKQFRRGFPASVLVTIHLPSHVSSGLDEVLSLAGHLQAGFARDGEVLQNGRIYVAPPNRHLLLCGGRVVLGAGARENNVRPAIDSMLRSAAVCCGFRAIGVVLTGTLGDGAAGLWTLRQAGGITVVQDPRDAAFSEMPLTALKRAKPDHVVGLADMPALLDNLVLQPAGQPRPIPRSLKCEMEIARCGDGHGRNGCYWPALRSRLPGLWRLNLGDR
jgi:two-component system, chemotaxis family, protein-glutamate methylesterase/glutaminase